MARQVHIHIHDQKARDKDISYRGYTIRFNEITGSWFLIKKGVTISYPSSEADAKKKVDELISLGLNDSAADAYDPEQSKLEDKLDAIDARIQKLEDSGSSVSADLRKERTEVQKRLEHIYKAKKGLEGKK